MEYITTTLGNLVHQTAFFSLTWGNVVMIAVACVFLYLAIRARIRASASCSNRIRYVTG